MVLQASDGALNQLFWVVPSIGAARRKCPIIVLKYRSRLDHTALFIRLTTKHGSLYALMAVERRCNDTNFTVQHPLRDLIEAISGHQKVDNDRRRLGYRN